MQPDTGRAEQRERFAAVYQLLDAAIDGQIFPGCAFGVLQGTSILALDGLGRQTYQADSALIEPSTVYDLASLTKVLATTPMAMLLTELGQLALDQPLGEILPEFLNSSTANQTALDQDARNRVTLRHLLAHSSGLAGYARLFEKCGSPEQLLKTCLGMPLQHAPGSHSEYSDIGFILLGHALEKLSGETIDSFCRREIYEPLGMDRTGYLPARDQWPGIPPTEDDRSFRHRVIQGEVQDENCWVLGGVSGHAGLFGNVADVLKFSAAVLLSLKGVGPKQEDRALFQAETTRLFASRSELPPGSSRALGWDTPSSPSSAGQFFHPTSIGHLGYAGTSVWIDIVDEVVVALLTNRTWPFRQDQRIREIRPLFHDRVRQAISASNTNVG